jgi:KaiC/GvpD/RAD55 family RecA-like ATPase
MRGLYLGEHALYITLEEESEKLVREAEMLGWPEIKRFIDENKLFFVESSGEDLKDYIRRTLPEIVSEAKKFKVKTRVAVDPLTPLLWVLNTEIEQRELLRFMFNNLRKIGTTMVTVEEHKGGVEELSGDVAIPVYLADAVVHLQYLGLGGVYNRSLRVVKFRGSAHGQAVYPYTIVGGFGVVCHATEEKLKVEQRMHDTDFDSVIEFINKNATPEQKEFLLTKIERARKEWIFKTSPLEVLDEFCALHGISGNSPKVDL